MITHGRVSRLFTSLIHPGHALAPTLLRRLPEEVKGPLGPIPDALHLAGAHRGDAQPSPEFGIPPADPVRRSATH